jgi:hypothetical protein
VRGPHTLAGTETPTLLRRFALLTLVLFCTPGVIHAQWIPVIVPDGSIPTRGTVRLGVSAELGAFDERFSRAGDGTREPLGADFSGAPFGAAQMPWLRMTETRIAALAGASSFDLSFGALDVQLRGRVERLPIIAEVGVLSRLALSAVVPVVRTRSAVIIGPGLGAGATVGVNPALLYTAAFTTDTALVNAFTRANAQLRTRLDQCAGSTAPECASVNQDRAAAEAFAANAATFTGHLAAVYLAATAVPVGATAADEAIAARIATMRAQFSGYGVTALSGAPARPAAAAPLAHGELQQLLTNPIFGIAGDSLATIERVSLGEIEVGGKFVVFDGTQTDPALPAPALGLRFTVGALVRLPTGRTDRPDNFVDIAPTDGGTDIEGQAFVDASLRRNAAVSLAIRYTRQLPHDATVRIPDFAGQPFQLATQERTVRRDPGDVLHIEASPRIALREFFSLGGYYAFRRKSADRSGIAPLAAPDPIDGPAPAPATVLDAGSATNEHRFGYGAGWANVAAYRRGRARFPYEISYLHLETRRARGGPVPALREDRVNVRMWLPLVFWR